MAVAAALSLLVLPVPESHAVTAASDSAGLSEGGRALAEAKASGSRVEVVGERSERTTVFANPDGFTFTLEQSVVPVRVAKGEGDWQAPDATLERRPDGSVGPKAAAVDMVFSGGGDDALVKLSKRGRSLELDWPTKLPAPRIDGSSAVYGDVLPDVDLMVTATVESFQQVLVVKTPEAAAAAELKKLSFGLKAKGLEVRTGAAGNLTAVDGNGQTVFRAPPARMWDSAGAAATSPPASLKGSAVQSEVEDPAVPGDAAETAPSGTGIEPGQGDNVARIDVEVAKDALAVVPDADMLAKTDEKAFPLFIDPTVTWGESERTLLRSDGYESYGWGNGDDGQGKGVGKCGTWSGYYCGPGYVQRLYFEFSPASLKGKQVLDVTFRVTEPWAFQCDPRWVDLVRTNNISSSTTWSSRPKDLDLMVDRHVSAGRGSLCDPDAPDAPIEFRDNPDETNENLTPTVRDFAAGKFSRLTLMLKAHDEGDTGAWKRFRNDAVLAVDFVGLPAKPTGIGLVTGSGTVCETKESDPAIVSDPTPTLTATPQTASGGEKDAQLRVAMDVDKKASDGTWSNAITEMERPTTGYVGDNVKLSASSPALVEGTLYRYRSWTRSYYNGGKSQLPGPSNASTTGWCYFKVDPTAPKAPKITFGTTYTECTTNACAPGGGPGVKDAFTFSAAAGDSNVAYQYRLSQDAAWSAERAGATVKETITPSKPGTFRLYVRAKDTVGRWGAQNLVDFLVAAGEGPVGRWHFDEADGDAKDAATADGADDVTLAGGAVRDDRGRRGLITHDALGDLLPAPVTDKGLSLNGTTGYAATGGPALETRSAYTVSTWVRLDSKASDAIVLSQDGAHYSPFIIWYHRQLDTWCFGTKDKDEATGNAYLGICGLKPAQLNAWTHVAGSYDPATQEVVFYVNGVLQGKRINAGTWEAAGALQIGRYKWADRYQYYFPGSIDEVAVWQRVLSSDEIVGEARLLTAPGYAATELVADWLPSRGSGSVIGDTTSGYGRGLTLTGGASLDGEELVLDGVDDAATATAPLVDDTGSFTVTTLVSLDEAKLAAKPVGHVGQVLGQRTADGSAWGLWFEVTGHKTVLDEETLEERQVPVGFWRFGRLNADGTSSSVVSDEEAAIDSPVRLTGIFDAQDATVSLRVGYVLNAEPKLFTAKAGSGEFAIGKGFNGGAWKYFLPARLAEVRVWAGAIASQEQAEDLVSD
ncbi:LamG-like jellyroll fold domain-containing protein [Streptomyces sp. NBC_01618]|uniref:LamG-like jellyroll fold domain-containing protein n=1 Tax=Streptomyces sp. NBC_01618 TaxID=2975900 RepID=UPI0038697376|nr:LamG domain protein jellyroll fold domain protein [Streptomyces sp. NBC_01618]